MKFKSLGGFHRPKPGRYRSVFIQMIQAIQLRTPGDATPERQKYLIFPSRMRFCPAV
jgi:hypothetical protein